MAITRATGKVCRNAFAWVMALAGYETTPAEEMDGVESRGSAASSAHEPRGRKRNEGRAPATISEPQRKRLWAITMEKAESLGMSKDEATNALRDVIQKFGVEQTTEIERKDYEAVVASVEKWG